MKLELSTAKLRGWKMGKYLEIFGKSYSQLRGIKLYLAGTKMTYIYGNQGKLEEIFLKTFSKRACEGHSA
jgi:hypothetical protein